uniref:Uncharacterized protein n=1 Tax=Knipowitschia caucasica TaxID=637954 RepID=A0AAV2JKT5_KNICA
MWSLGEPATKYLDRIKSLFGVIIDNWTSSPPPSRAGVGNVCDMECQYWLKIVFSLWHFLFSHQGCRWIGGGRFFRLLSVDGQRQWLNVSKTLSCEFDWNPDRTSQDGCFSILSLQNIRAINLVTSLAASLWSLGRGFHGKIVRASWYISPGFFTRVERRRDPYPRVAENTMISSMKTRTSLRCSPAMQRSISRWNVLGAFVTPCGILFHSQNPKLQELLLVVAGVFPQMALLQLQRRSVPFPPTPD